MLAGASRPVLERRHKTAASTALALLSVSARTRDAWEAPPSTRLRKSTAHVLRARVKALKRSAASNHAAPHSKHQGPDRPTPPRVKAATAGGPKNLMPGGSRDALDHAPRTRGGNADSRATHRRTSTVLGKRSGARVTDSTNGDVTDEDESRQQGIWYPGCTHVTVIKKLRDAAKKARADFGTAEAAGSLRGGPADNRLSNSHQPAEQAASAWYMRMGSPPCGRPQHGHLQGGMGQPHGPSIAGKDQGSPMGPSSNGSTAPKTLLKDASVSWAYGHEPQNITFPSTYRMGGAHRSEANEPVVSTPEEALAWARARFLASQAPCDSQSQNSQEQPLPTSSAQPAGSEHSMGSAPQQDTPSPKGNAPSDQPGAAQPPYDTSASRENWDHDGDGIEGMSSPRQVSREGTEPLSSFAPAVIVFTKSMTGDMCDAITSPTRPVCDALAVSTPLKQSEQPAAARRPIQTVEPSNEDEDIAIELSGGSEPSPDAPDSDSDVEIVEVINPSTTAPHNTQHQGRQRWQAPQRPLPGHRKPATQNLQDLALSSRSSPQRQGTSSSKAAEPVRAETSKPVAERSAALDDDAKPAAGSEAEPRPQKSKLPRKFSRPGANIWSSAQRTSALGTSKNGSNPVGYARPAAEQPIRISLSEAATRGHIQQQPTHLPCNSPAAVLDPSMEGFSSEVKSAIERAASKPARTPLPAPEQPIRMSLAEATTSLRCNPQAGATGASMDGFSSAVQAAAERAARSAKPDSAPFARECTTGKPWKPAPVSGTRTERSTELQECKQAPAAAPVGALREQRPHELPAAASGMHQSASKPGDAITVTGARQLLPSTERSVPLAGKSPISSPNSSKPGFNRRKPLRPATPSLPLHRPILWQAGQQGKHREALRFLARPVGTRDLSPRPPGGLLRCSAGSR